MSSRKPAGAAAFLKALDFDQTTVEETPIAPSPATKLRTQPKAVAEPVKAVARSKRDGLKHIGGYLPDDIVERFARLKIRTKLGNDDLLALAINELWRIEGTKRKWEE